MKGWLIQLGCLMFAQALAAAPLQQTQPWLGVAVDEKAKDGVLVKSVLQKTPAEKAGIQSGDLITAIDELPVKNRDELMGILRSKGVGNSVTVVFQRKGKAEKKTLKLEAIPDRVELMQKQLMDKPVPPFALTTLGTKKPISQQDLIGKVTILEFWATWCPACRAAIPRLNQWAKTRKNIQIIGISDEKEEVVQAFLKTEKIDYTIAIDSQDRIQADFQIGSIPTFILVDPKGVVREIALGAGDYLETLIQKAERLNSKTP